MLYKLKNSTKKRKGNDRAIQNHYQRKQPVEAFKGNALFFKGIQGA
jgi:hypothetical protein